MTGFDVSEMFSLFLMVYRTNWVIIFNGVKFYKIWLYAYFCGYFL